MGSNNIWTFEFEWTNFSVFEAFLKPLLGKKEVKEILNFPKKNLYWNRCGDAKRKKKDNFLTGDKISLILVRHFFNFFFIFFHESQKGFALICTYFQFCINFQLYIWLKLLVKIYCILVKIKSNQIVLYVNKV